MSTGAREMSVFQGLSDGKTWQPPIAGALPAGAGGVGAGPTTGSGGSGSGSDRATVRAAPQRARRHARTL